MYTARRTYGASKIRIAVVGDAMLDEQVCGSVDRISPEAPVAVVEVTSREYNPGGAAHVAASIAALGADASIVGVLGADRQASMLRARLDEAGVDTRALLTDARRCTTTKSRIVARRQQIVRIDEENRRPLHESVEELVVAVAETILPDSQALVLSDYGKGVLTPRVCAALIASASRAGCPVLVDPKGRDLTKYRGASILTPNTREAFAALHDDPILCYSVESAGHALLDLMEGADVLITRGADGMTLFRRGRPPFSLPAHVRQVFDVTGAGDTVIAVLAMCIAAGDETEGAVRLANYAAGLAVAKMGAAVVTAQELAGCRKRVARSARREQSQFTSPAESSAGPGVAAAAP